MRSEVAESLDQEARTGGVPDTLFNGSQVPGA